MSFIEPGEFFHVQGNEYLRCLNGINIKVKDKEGLILDFIEAWFGTSKRVKYKNKRFIIDNKGIINQNHFFQILMIRHLHTLYTGAYWGAHLSSFPK